MELRKGWLTLLGITLGMCFGAAGLLPYVTGLFAKAVTADLGWTLTQVATVTSLVSFGTAMAAPIWGAVVDRIGALATAIIGYIAMVTALLLLAAVPANLLLYGVGMASVMWLGTATTAVTFLPVLRQTFDRQRGLALGLMLAGVGIVGVTAPVVMAAVIHGAGWRMGYRFLGLMGVIGGGMAVSIIAATGHGRRRMQHDHRQKADTSASRSEMLRDPVLWRLLVGFLVLAVAVNGYLFHLVPMLTSYGLSLERAALTQSAFGLGMITVRLGVGALMDRYFAPRLATWLVVLAALGLVILAGQFGGTAAHVPAALLIGMVYGSEVDLMGYLASRYFDPASFGKAYGLLYGIGILGNGTSPLWISYLSHNGTHYTLPLVLSVCLLMIPGLIFTTAPPFRHAVGH